jgi:hypothetical protein
MLLLPLFHLLFFDDSSRTSGGQAGRLGLDLNGLLWLCDFTLKIGMKVKQINKSRNLA